MKEENLPPLRRDLEFFPLSHQGKQLLLVRDHLGLVPEGITVEIPLYQLMTMLDGATTLRDLQMTLMRESGGMLVSSDEVQSLIAQLDDSFILASEKFVREKERLVADFLAMKTRPSCLSGRAYPAEPRELTAKLEEILALEDSPKPPGKTLALVAPHIDLASGARIYARAYRALRGASPKTVIIIGIGHRMAEGLFALSDKDFATPLGVAECDRRQVEKLRLAAGAVMAKDDFVHRDEHSVEFQILFLQHVLPKDSFRIVPLLCGSPQIALGEYSRRAYREKAGPLLEALQDILAQEGGEVLVVAGVDFSHTGPKFGHELPAHSLQRRSEAHDRALLEALAERNADAFWEESRKVKDQYNVCGFAALACLLEVLPACQGHILGYEIWHEEATRSAVSYAALAFTERTSRS